MKFLINTYLSCIFVIVFGIAATGWARASTVRRAVTTKEESPRDLANEERNKAIVLDFYQGLFGDKDFSVIEKYVDDNIIQHNPRLPDGKDAIIKFFREMFPPDAPKTKIHIARIIAEGDYVWMHFKNKFGAEPEVAVVDIFRLKDGKLIELFDVIQPIPHKSLNPHPMFNILEKEYKLHSEYHRHKLNTQDSDGTFLESNSDEE